MGSFRTADTARIPYQDEPMVGAFVDITEYPVLWLRIYGLEVFGV